MHANLYEPNKFRKKITILKKKLYNRDNFKDSLIKPKFCVHDLRSLPGQFSGSHFLITFIKIFNDVQIFGSRQENFLFNRKHF